MLAARCFQTAGCVLSFYLCAKQLFYPVSETKQSEPPAAVETAAGVSFSIAVSLFHAPESGQELLRLPLLGVAKDLCRCALFADHALVHEHHL